MPPRPETEVPERGFVGGTERWWLTVAAATLVAGAVRILSPGDGPFWRDEALFVFVSRIAPIGELLGHLHQHESHPPLFYLMMRAWTAVAGPGDAALRALPFALSVSLVPVTAWFGSRAFGPMAGLAAAIIVAVHPNLAFHSVQVRPYAALMLLGLASSYALWRVVETPERRAVVGYVLATVGMVYLHHWSWLLLAAQGAALLLVVVIGGADVRAWAPRVLGAWIVVGLGYLPMIPTFLRHSRLAGHPGERFGPDDALGRFADVTIAQLQSRVGVAVLLLAFGAVIMRRNGWSWASAGQLRAYAVLGLIAPLTVAIALPASASTNLLVPHTLTTLIPFVALGIGAGISALHGDRRYVEGVLLIALLATALGLDFVRLQGTHKSNAAALADAMESHSLPTDVVIVAPDRYASSFNYYFDGRNQQVAYPSGGRREVVYFDGYYDRISDTATLSALSDSIRAFERRGARVWLVSDETIFGDTTPLPERLPVENSAEEHLAGRVRARQVEKMLRDAYGAPDSIIVPDSGSTLVEGLGAERFGPRAGR
jgi:hypothetical protein